MINLEDMYKELFNRINEEIPYLDGFKYAVNMEETKDYFEQTKNTFKAMRKSISGNDIKMFEFYETMIGSCLSGFELFEMIKDRLNAHATSEYPKMLEGLNQMETFVTHFENQKLVTDVIENYMYHVSAMTEYYRAILQSELSNHL